MNIQFQYLELLWLLLLLPLLAFLKGRSGKSVSILFSNVKLVKDIARKTHSSSRKWLFLFRLLALGSLILALARPREGNEFTEVEASGIDIVLAIDVSSSMLALDFTQGSHAITRIDVVKNVIEQFIRKRKNDRIGIIAFAGNPYLVSPLTLNHDWLISNLSRIRVGGGIEDGTAIGSAIGSSVNRLREIESKSKIVVLLTDGVNNAGKVNPIAAAEAAAKLKTKIYTIAAGKGGIVPALYLNQKGEIARTRDGQPDIIRANIPVDETVLQEVAEITGGGFYRARDIKQLESIYDTIDALEKTDIKVRQMTDYKELFHWLALIALAFIIIELLLNQTLYRRIP